MSHDDWMYRYSWRYRLARMRRKIFGANQLRVWIICILAGGLLGACVAIATIGIG